MSNTRKAAKGWTYYVVALDGDWLRDEEGTAQTDGYTSVDTARRVAGRHDGAAKVIGYRVGEVNPTAF